MALMLQEDISYSIAIRHFANSLLGNIQKIDDEKNAIGLRYIDTMVYQLIDQLTDTQRKLDTLSHTILEQGVQFAENELLKYEEEYKYACYDLIKKLYERKNELKRAQNKFEGLLIEVLSLGKRSLFSFVMESRSKKNDRVKELEDGLPTFPKIATILRLHELEQSSLIMSAQQKIEFKAIFIKEAYTKEVEELSEDGAPVNTIYKAYYQNIKDDIKDEIVQIAFESIEPILLNNESKRTFLTVKVPTIADRFMDKHNGKFEEFFKEAIEEA